MTSREEYIDIYDDQTEMDGEGVDPKFGEEENVSGNSGRGILVIGDTHFESKAFEEGQALSERCIEIARGLHPECVILLGDILDTHETAKQSPFDQACSFIDRLSQECPVYVQMGNHDLINQTQYLSDKHFFNPLKKWENVTIVDVPTPIFLNDGLEIISCPYTPPGKLIEALDTLSMPTDDRDGIDWTTARCIFGHQEMRGVMYRSKPSTTGDTWEPSFPFFISGHIHGACDIGDNISYVGSSRQVDSNESPDKKVWHILFNDPGDDLYEERRGVWIQKIDLNLKGIKEVRLDFEEVKNFDFGLLDTYYITLHIKGTSEQFKVFKKGQLYAKMIRLGIKIRFDTERDSTSPLNIIIGDVLSNAGIEENESSGSHTFESIFYALVQTKTDAVKEAYQILIPEDAEEEEIEVPRIPTKMVFVGRKI